MSDGLSVSSRRDLRDTGLPKRFLSQRYTSIYDYGKGDSMITKDLTKVLDSPFSAPYYENLSLEVIEVMKRM